MKVWNVIHRSISTILVTVLTLVLVSSYGAGNVVASYAAKATGGDSITVAKFNGEINPLNRDGVNLVALTDENAANGICFPFVVKVDTEVTCVLDLAVQFDGQTSGFDLYLLSKEDDQNPLSPDYVSTTRDVWEFHGASHLDRPEFKFAPSSGETTRIYYLLFKEAYEGSINHYQLQDHIEVTAKIVQVD